MKRTVKNIIALLIAVIIIIPAFAFDTSAAVLNISGGNYEVGQTVSIPVKFNAENYNVFGTNATVTYDSKVLKLTNVSGATDFNVVSAGNVVFTDTNFSASKPSKTCSYTLVFSAIGAGTTNVNVSFVAGGIDSAGANKDDTKSASAKITVTTPKPSSNANLSSIKLSAGSLTPAFDPNTLFYDVTVKYEVDEITITGTKADGKSTYIGGGTFALEVGDDNEQVLTVTAEDGTKKSYVLYIKRMTEEETLAAEDEERNSNPTLVVINGVDYTIDNELAGVEIPVGFTKTTAVRKESEITVLKDDAGKYQLCWLVDNNGEGAYYIRDEADNFTKLIYINAGGKMYIVEALSIDGILPSDYKYSKCVIDGVEVKCITYVDEKLSDFNIFSCYIDGKTYYYRLDSKDGTMQRAVDLEIALTTEETVAPTNPQDNSTASNDDGVLKNVNKTGKIVLALIVAVAVILIAIAIILIAKIASSKDDYDYGDEETNAKDFVFGDDFVEEKSEPIEQPTTELPIVVEEPTPETAEENLFEDAPGLDPTLERAEETDDERLPADEEEK